MATPWINQPTAPSPDRCVLFCAAIFLNHSVSRTTPWFGPDPRAYVWPPLHPRTPHPRCAPSLFPPLAPVHTHGRPHACQHARFMTNLRTNLITPPPLPPSPPAPPGVSSTSYTPDRPSCYHRLPIWASTSRDFRRPGGSGSAANSGSVCWSPLGLDGPGFLGAAASCQ